MRVYAELAPHAGPRRDRRHRRRGFRLLRRPGDRQLPAGLLAGQRTVRLPGLGARATRWPPNSPGPTVRSSCCRATARSGSAAWNGTRWSRHNVPVVSVIGNNGIWALEKHPMEALYGYSVVAELRPGTRYDEVVRALGGHGELVSTPAELRPALERAFASRAARRRQRAHRPDRRLSAPLKPGLTAPRTCAVVRVRPVCRAQTRTLAPECPPGTVDLCLRPPATDPAV